MTYCVQVYLQTGNGSMQCIAMHAEFIGSLALISSFLPQSSQHESPLEFTDRLIESQTGAVHLLNDRLKLPLHDRLLQKSEACTYQEGHQRGKGRDFGYALAADSCEGANNVEACTITAL